MIKVNILYPNGPQVVFDFDYYRNTHLPLVAELMGDALKDTQVDAGLDMGPQGEKAPYIAIGTLYFASVEVFQAAFGLHTEQLMADVPNFTNTTPVVQVNEQR
ncbi:EthD family reductase [Cobetia sp. L2A1]|uniref:EthD family reductase n=1 Tax=Cobetia sp. L2A1 TaxID=2686360 RepID=UPI00131B096A|nr:EthD family reductase [Cobetia sp. L2A1]